MNLIKDCGKVDKIITGRESKNTAKIHFNNNDGRAKAILLDKMTLKGGSILQVSWRPLWVQLQAARRPL